MATDPRFDRVKRPDPGVRARRHDDGKEALYTTSPEAPPAAPVSIHCERCGTQRALAAGDLVSLVRPPLFFNPVRDGGRLWARCPACHKRSWLRFHAAGALGAYLTRPKQERAKD